MCVHTPSSDVRHHDCVRCLTQTHILSVWLCDSIKGNKKYYIAPLIGDVKYLVHGTILSPTLSPAAATGLILEWLAGHARCHYICSFFPAPPAIETIKPYIPHTYLCCWRSVASTNASDVHGVLRCHKDPLSWYQWFLLHQWRELDQVTLQQTLHTNQHLDDDIP